MDKKILEEAIRKYGVKEQVIVAIEELAELQKELTKFLRGKGIYENIIEELSDVEIMLEQIRMMMHLSEVDIVAAKYHKIRRLEKKVAGNNEHE